MDNSLENEETSTGNAEIDKLLNEFDLSLVEYKMLESSSYAIVTLQSDRVVNVFAVGRLFKKHQGITEAGSEMITDGDEINVLFFSNELRYYFEMGFGDCPSGCTSSHTWLFTVSENGSVNFLGEEGDPLPGE